MMMGKRSDDCMLSSCRVIVWRTSRRYNSYKPRYNCIPLPKLRRSSMIVKDKTPTVLHTAASLKSQHLASRQNDCDCRTRVAIPISACGRRSGEGFSSTPTRETENPTTFPDVS
jgi:hypothetical protein